MIRFLLLLLFLSFSEARATLIIAVKTDSAIYVGVDSRVSWSDSTGNYRYNDNAQKAIETDSFQFILYGNCGDGRADGLIRPLMRNKKQYMPLSVKGTLKYYHSLFDKKLCRNSAGAVVAGVCNRELLLCDMVVYSDIYGKIKDTTMCNLQYCARGMTDSLKKSDVDYIMQDEGKIPERISTTIKNQMNYFKEIGGDVRVYKITKRNIVQVM